MDALTACTRHSVLVSSPTDIGIRYDDNANLPMNTLYSLAGKSSIKCWYPRL
jgi:hypothetical protein